MNLIQQRRTLLVISLVLGVGVTVGLILYALSQNINLFYTPTQLYEQNAQLNHQSTLRLGGMVVKNSVRKFDNLQVEFILTDFNQEIKVDYQGILPDLFKEGQGIVALGVLKKEANGTKRFQATQVLAKHDEKYMPPEITQALANPSSPLKREL